MAEDYITILHQLAGSCEYGEIKDEMIHNRLVVGIRDESLSERLQMEVDLTLDKAKMLIRQREAVQQQQWILKDESKIEAVNVRHKKYRTGKTQKRTLNPSQTVTRQPVPDQPQMRTCKRCGKGSHPCQLYPARDATCYCFNRKGHYSSKCLSRTMGEVTTLIQQPNIHSLQEDNDLYSDTIYLNAVNNTNDKQWHVTMLVETNSVSFKVDTGAEVTALSDVTFQSFTNPVPKLQQSSQTLCGPNRSPLKVIGEATIKLTYKGRSCTHTFATCRITCWDCQPSSHLK